MVASISWDINVVDASVERQGRAGQPYTLSAETLDGAPVSLTLGQNRDVTVIFGFSPTCPECAATVPDWQILCATLQQHVRFYAVAVDGSHFGVREYAAKKDLKFPILINPSDTTRNQLRMSRIPVTVVIRPSEEVPTFWYGRLAYHRSEVLTMLGVRLLPYPLNFLQAAMASAHRS